MDKKGMVLMFRESYGAQVIRHWRRNDPAALDKSWRQFVREYVAKGWIKPAQAEKWIAKV